MARSRSGTRNRRGPRKPQRRPEAVAVQVAEPQERGAVELPAALTVKELSELLRVNPADVIRELIRNGIFANINQPIDRDTAALVATELGFEVAEPVGAEDEGEVEAAAAELARVPLFTEDDPSELVLRAPIVTVMGHVDHGKTSLLDAIRATNVVAGERGGITQAIGASEIAHGDRRVVFLDTPGHEAFTQMRARGAKVTDIAVLVVAADDGVMPQTIEAIDHARAAKVPIVVALNKIDKPDANPERVKTQLSEHGLVVEEFGGDVPLVAVSAKQRTGIDDLIEMINLVADLQELKANPKRPAIGTVIEAELDPQRGPIASVIVQTGTLRVGDAVVVGGTYGRVRALENSQGERIGRAGPASAVVVSGIADVPEAGDVLRVLADDKAARAEAEKVRLGIARPEQGRRATLEDLYRQIQAGKIKELRIVFKADVQGSLEAIKHSLESLSSDEVRIRILHEGAGEITDNDVLLASASDAIIVGFNTRLDPQARRTAEAEGVDVRLYDIIYKLTDDIEAALKGMLEPEIQVVVEGRAEVRQIFRAGKALIAGCQVTEGRIVRGGGARVYRAGKVIATEKIESLRRFRDDVREVAAGFECGIGLSGNVEIAEGDIIECTSQQTVARAGG